MGENILNTTELLVSMIDKIGNERPSNYTITSTMKSKHITPEIERAIRIKAIEQTIAGGKRLLMMGSPGLGVAELVQFQTEVEHRIEKLQQLQQHSNG